MSKVISKDGSRIAYDKTGSGPAVILVDGAMGYRALFGLNSLAEQLAEHFTVYTYDRRGRVSSDTLPMRSSVKSKTLKPSSTKQVVGLRLWISRRSPCHGSGHCTG
jgi:YD repeat-containing protein